MASISVIIIVKDAVILDYSPVQTILSSLEIPSVNKVFVNEGMSSDGTYELISSIKDDRLEIIRRDWRMDKSFWAEERNYLINIAKNYSDYLLILDADEFLFKEDVGIIEDFIKNPNGFYGMKFKYLHYFRVFDGNSKECLRINKNPAWYQEHAKLVHFSLNPRLEIVGHNADDFVGTFKEYTSSLSKHLSGDRIFNLKVFIFYIFSKLRLYFLANLLNIEKIFLGILFSEKEM
jgi:hypothetical protein